MPRQPATGEEAMVILNGPGAAAILAAGVGCFAIGLIGVLADKLPALALTLNIYKPTGPLSGVSTAAIVTWLAAWALLHYAWRRRDVNLRRVTALALLLLALGVLLTFPPIRDVF